ENGFNHKNSEKRPRLDVDEESIAQGSSEDQSSASASVSVSIPAPSKSITIDESELPDNPEEIDPALLVENFELDGRIKQKLLAKGFKALFPIQAAVFEPISQGKDVLARARTGTGKTLAFSLPIANKLMQKDCSRIRGRSPRTVIMAPTRELAKQVSLEFESISSNLSVDCFYGGVSIDAQFGSLKRGLDILVGTPGRILDHLERGSLSLKDVEFLCLDEADQMLDIGFKDDMETVLKTLKDHRPSSAFQILLFSATVPDWVANIVKQFMTDHVKVDLIGKSKLKTSELIEHLAVMCSWAAHHDVVADLLSVYGLRGRAIIFAETKAEVTNLISHPKMKTEAMPLHGDITQAVREQTLKMFRDGSIQYLVCTDVAARGLDIPEVDLVINSEPPKEVETYIHRSGRTGRAGRNGVCITCFSPQKSFWPNMIRRSTGIECKLVSPPQIEDIATASGSSAASIVAECDPSLISLFVKPAIELANDKFDGNVTNALASALACLAGYSSGLKRRSLLSGSDKHTTLVMLIKQPARSGGFARSVLQKNYTDLLFEDTNNFRLSVDGCQIVFDINSEKLQIKSPGKLEESQRNGSSFRGNFGGRSFGNRGRDNGYGNNRNGGGGGSRNWNNRGNGYSRNSASGGSGGNFRSNGNRFSRGNRNNSSGNFNQNQTHSANHSTNHQKW
ncbi:hypothetical protein BB560_003778, partial [Smittium megazygosporum]